MEHRERCLKLAADPLAAEAASHMAVPVTGERGVEVWSVRNRYADMPWDSKENAVGWFLSQLRAGMIDVGTVDALEEKLAALRA